MRRFSRLAVMVLVFSAVCQGIFGQEVPPGPDSLPLYTLSLSELAQTAQDRNLDVRKAHLEVDQRQRDLAGELERTNTTVSLLGRYERTVPQDGTWNGSGLSVTAPIFPQLSLNAGVSLQRDQQFAEEFSATLRPLERSTPTFQEEADYAAARIRRRYLLRRIYLQTEAAALDVIVQEMRRNTAAEELALQEEMYELLVRQQTIGAVSFRDVQDQLSETMDARSAFFSARQEYARSWNALQRLFAPADARYAVQGVTQSELADLIAKRRETISMASGIPPTTEEMEILEVRLDSRRTELLATPGWEPVLDLTAGVGFNRNTQGETEPTATGSIRLSFSPNQSRADDRQALRQDIEILEMEIDAETYAAELEKSLREQSIAIYEEALAAAQLQEEQDRLALREAELLIRRGSRTVLERDELALNLSRSEIRTFQSAVNLYVALGDYLILLNTEERP